MTLKGDGCVFRLLVMRAAVEGKGSFSLQALLSEENIRSLASSSVRQIDDETYRRLRVRAAGKGVSMEEEGRRILKRAVAAPERLGDLAIEYFGPDHGVELEEVERESRQALNLDE